MTWQLRWILLIIGVVFIAALAWWERRRPRQASASSASERPSPRDLTGEPAPRPQREPALALPEMRARDPLPTHQLPAMDAVDEDGHESAAAAAAAEPAVTDEGARLAVVEPPQFTEPQPHAAPAADFAYVPKVEAAAAEAPAMSAAPAAASAAREVLPELPAAAPPVVEWPPDDQRHILALRLVAPQPQRFAGRSVRQALAAEGFVLGRFAIFHKPDEERRAVLSAASLNRPGTFDADTMDSQHYGGLSLFAVLPGPKPPPQAFDELVFTARSLNERLHGVLQDEQGGPLTPARVASLRERLRPGATL
jgi:cell division protein ZipA